MHFTKAKCLNEENRLYFIFTVEEVMEIVGRPNKMAVKILNEPDRTAGGIGLIERSEVLESPLSSMFKT